MHRHQLSALAIIRVAVYLLAVTGVGVSADSFQGQFSSPTYYGLAIAGISLGAALGAALLALLIFCLIRRHRKKDQKLARSDTEASNSTNKSRGGIGGGTTFGPMALPGVAKPVDAVRNGAGGGVRLMSDIGNGGGVRGGSSGVSGGGSSGGADSGGRRRAPAAPSGVQYINPAFTSGADSGVVVSTTSLFRNSSFLRPVSYSTSLESNKPRGGAPTDSAVIQHPAVRTSPASTLDPRTFLSQDGLGQRQLVPPPSHLRLAGVPDQTKRMSYAEEPQYSLQKRLSYAEQRVKTGSTVELVSGQVFASSTSTYALGADPGAARPARALPRQPAPLVRTLPTQPEEEFVAAVRKKQPAPQPPPLEEGPSFPKTATRSMSFAKQQPQPPQQPQQQPQQVEQRPHQSLHRIQLGGGEDGRSVTSTVLKQEALQAFEFLEGYD